MPILRVIDRSGVELEIESSDRKTIMEVMREHDCPVAATCGGTCSCGTCHIYVHADWRNKLPSPMPDEEELLSALIHTRPESRLSCQIEFTTALDGLRIEIAPEE